MRYTLRYKKNRKTYEGTKGYKTKAMAQSRARFLRQMDDDLPKSKRAKWLKTIKVVKLPIKRKLKRG